uniref:Uncharacterized protein LOC114333879 n=1 Tax=Diabrotica virgifera virgifera TaxID=50390 RepID=A0A6P7FTB4_DIAVI
MLKIMLIILLLVSSSFAAKWSNFPDVYPEREASTRMTNIMTKFNDYGKIFLIDNLTAEYLNLFMGGILRHLTRGIVIINLDHANIPARPNDRSYINIVILYEFRDYEKFANTSGNLLKRDIALIIIQRVSPEHCSLRGTQIFPTFVYDLQKTTLYFCGHRKKYLLKNSVYFDSKNGVHEVYKFMRTKMENYFRNFENRRLIVAYDESPPYISIK